MSKKAYVQIHIPKTAGSFIKSLEAPKIFTKKFKGLPSPTYHHYTLRYLKKYLPSAFNENIGIFTVVRNPYARIYSLWRYLNVEVSAGGGGIFGDPYLPLITDEFKIFVEDLCTDYYMGYYGMQSQMYYIDGYKDVKNFQFFKLEETEKLKNFLVNCCNATWSDKKVNESTFSTKDYKNVYTPEIIEMVKTKFKEEFEAFDYSVDL